MKLIAIAIKNLWGNKTFSIKFNEDVNIFSGINGSGKTTILEIIHSVLNGDAQDEDCCDKYEGAQVFFSEGHVVDIISSGGKKCVTYSKDGVEISKESFLQQITYACISSFDYTPFPVEERRKLKEKYSWIRTELDYGIAMALQEYYMYIVSLNNQVRRALEQKPDKTDQLLKYFQDLFEMQDICDNLFAPHLKWDRESDEVSFLLTEYENKKINPHELSAGEKQMLILLISTLVQKKREGIVLWDEPELSMHVDWQRILIATMQKINPNMQLILTTHSPFILYDGWENRVLNIQNIIK